MSKSHSLLLLLLSCSVFLIAQNQSKADSLKLQYSEGDLSDSVKLIVLTAIGINETNAVEAMDYANKLLLLATKLNRPEKMGEAYEEIGIRHHSLGDPVKSTEALLQALAIYERLNMPIKEIAVRSQLASNQVLDGQYREASDNFRWVVLHYHHQKDTIRAAYTMINLGEAWRLAGQLDSAEWYFRKSLLMNTTNDAVITGYSSGNIGMVYHARGKLEEAMEMLQKANDILRELGDLYSISVYTFELGTILVEMGRLEEGRQLLLEAYEIAVREKLNEQIRDFSEGLSAHYQSTADFKQALVYQQTYQQYKDSLINIDNVRKVAQLRSQYEVEKREAEIMFLNTLNAKQRQTVLLLLTGTCILALLIGLLYRSNQLKKKANHLLSKREREKALLLRELNHRTKNNFQMISSLLNLQSSSLEDHPAAEAIRQGRYRVDCLALVHQKLYRENYSYLELKPYLEELVERLVDSFNPNVKAAIHIDAMQLKVDTAVPLALIINELLTNSLKYGKPQNGEEALIRLIVQKEASTLTMDISDNGPGIDREDMDKLDSFGMKLVHSLAYQLNADLTMHPDGHWNMNMTL